MYVDHDLSAMSLQAFYEELARETEALIAGERSPWANLSNVSALLNQHLRDINWVGFYLWDAPRNELVLGPFQGKPACIRIPYGRGVCGKAFAEHKSQVVEDVFSFEGHIACDSASRSEIVVPLISSATSTASAAWTAPATSTTSIASQSPTVLAAHADETAFGVLDIDSPLTGRFSAEDERGLAAIVRILIAGTDLPTSVS